MNKKLIFTFLMVMIAGFSLYAADEATGETVSKTVTDPGKIFLWSIIVGGVAMASAAIVGALAQSKAIQVASENIGRNPAAADSIRGILIIGLALIESLVIYVLLIDLIIFFMKWGQYSIQ
jgi:F-type H+-transporting ATPase subunit c